MRTDEERSLEAQRGIVRDGEGRILRDAEWKIRRIAYLIARMAEYELRIASCKAEIAVLSGRCPSWWWRVVGWIKERLGWQM